MATFEAKSSSASHYVTGKPCKNGHLTKRRVSDNHCVECDKMRRKMYYANNIELVSLRAKEKRNDNPEFWRERERHYYHNDIEAYRKRSLKYAANHRDEASETARQFYINNIEHCANISKLYRQNNPGKLAAISAKRYAQILKATPRWANFELIETFYVKSNTLTKVTGIQHEVDHIVPLQGKFVSGLHVENNLQVLTKDENNRKSNKHE